MKSIYEGFNPVEEVEMKNLIQSLLSGKYICGFNKEHENEYRIIMMMKYREPISEILRLVGYDLVVAELSKTIYIKRQDDVRGPKNNLGLAATKLVYVLKKHFLAEMKKLDTNGVVYYKWNDLLSEFTPFMKKANEKVQLIESLWTLKSFGFVDINTPKKDMKRPDADDEVVISIFPSITCICHMDAIEMIEEELLGLVASIKEGEKEEDNE